MLHHHRRPDLAARNDFTFFSPISNHLEYNTWAENLKTQNNSFNKQNSHSKSGPWARAEIPYGASSPPLWKSASSDSRAQMISKYRQEMMELVRELPESAYELSLRDMVELNPVRRREEEKEEALLTGSGRRTVRSGRRSCSMDSGGFYLKFFMPSILSVVGSGRKISPRSVAVGGDGEWISGRSSSNGSNGSSDSICGGSRRKRWKLGGCYSFFNICRRSRSR